MFLGESPPIKFKRTRSTGKQITFFRKCGHIAAVPLQDRWTFNPNWEHWDKLHFLENVDALPQCPFRTDEHSMLTGTHISVYLKSSNAWSQRCPKSSHHRLMLHSWQCFCPYRNSNRRFPVREWSTADPASPISGTRRLVSVSKNKKSDLEESRLRALNVPFKLSWRLRTPWMTLSGLKHEDEARGSGTWKSVCWTGGNSPRS